MLTTQNKGTAELFRVEVKESPILQFESRQSKEVCFCYKFLYEIEARSLTGNRPWGS